MDNGVLSCAWLFIIFEILCYWYSTFLQAILNHAVQIIVTNTVKVHDISLELLFLEVLQKFWGKITNLKYPMYVPSWKSTP